MNSKGLTYIDGGRMQASGESQSWPGQIDSSGRVQIPAESRHALGWERGTQVVLECDGDSLRILTLDQFTKEVQELFGHGEPGESLQSEELIRERRREAMRERISG